MTTVATLVAAKSADTLRAELLASLLAAGFPTTAWQPGSVPRSLVFADATALAATSCTSGRRLPRSTTCAPGRA